MTDSSQAAEQPGTETSNLAGAEPDAPDQGADYDPDADQDTEPSTMAPAGGRPTDPPD